MLAAYLLTRGGVDATPAGPRTAAAASAATSAVTSGAKSRSTPQGTDPSSGLRWVAESALPQQARETLARIRAGGPYPYPRSDNQVFGNREGRLPAKPNGYYREYTVITPGSEDRGARRIIAGRDGDKYYTDDHYDSFQRIQEGT